MERNQEFTFPTFLTHCPLKKSTSIPHHQSKVLSEVEDIMALLAFPNPTESPIRSLLSSDRRVQVARELNEAILEHQHLSKGM